MTTLLTLTLDRLRGGQYRVGITPPTIPDEDLSTSPSIFEVETLGEAISGLGDRLLAFCRAHHERALPRTEVDADLRPFLDHEPG